MNHEAEVAWTAYVVASPVDGQLEERHDYWLQRLAEVESLRSSIMNELAKVAFALDKQVH